MIAELLLFSIIVLLLLDLVASLSVVYSTRINRVALSASSQDTAIAKPSSTRNTIPYVQTRGDGMTGGGGVTMKGDQTSLRRPKVGAKMPQGRPEWFKVPAPSQGKEKQTSDILARRFFSLEKYFSLTN